MTITLYCDGLVEPTNPGGTACWGFVAYAADGQELHTAHGTLGQGPGMTNNLAEYTAVIEALLWAEYAGHRGFSVYTDSQLVVKQVQREFACHVRHLQVLRDRVRKGLSICQATIAWVPREQNQRADALTRKAYAAATHQDVSQATRILSEDAQDASDHASRSTAILERHVAVYVAALRALDAMDAAVQDGFETDFLVSNLARVQQYGDRIRFSPKQQAVIRTMVEQYLGAAQAAEWFHGQQRLTGV